MSRYDYVESFVLGLDDEGLQDLYELLEDDFDIERDLSPYSEDIQRVYKILCNFDPDHVDNLDVVIDNEMERRDLFVEDEDECSTSLWDRIKTWVGLEHPETSHH